MFYSVFVLLTVRLFVCQQDNIDLTYLNFDMTPNCVNNLSALYVLSAVVSVSSQWALFSALLPHCPAAAFNSPLYLLSLIVFMAIVKID